MSAHDVADLLVGIMHGNDRAELEQVLDAALDRYELARLGAVARTRLGQRTAKRDSRIREQLIAEGLLKTQ